MSKGAIIAVAGVAAVVVAVVVYKSVTTGRGPLAAVRQALLSPEQIARIRARELEQNTGAGHF